MGNITLYAYFDINNPYVAWEVAVGRIKSSCDDGAKGFGISLWEYNNLKKACISGGFDIIADEFALEFCRANKYPDKVSRLTGVYFFESEFTAHQALEHWRLEKNKKFISQVNFSANKLSRHDSEWIRDCMGNNDREWFDDYLSGATRWANPLTEVIASGIGIVVNKDLRRLAYERVLQIWPTSSMLLYCAIAAFAEGKIEDVALSRPFLSLREGKLIGDFYIYMDSFESRQEEVGAAVVDFRRKGFSAEVIFPEDDEAAFTLPDLGEMSFELAVPDAATMYRLLHRS